MAFVSQEPTRVFGTFSAASGVVTPPPSNPSSHPDESTDTTSPGSNTFSDSSKDETKPPGESFQLQSWLEQPPSHDSMLESGHGCLGRPPAAETIAQDPIAARRARIQTLLDDIDRRLRSASDSGAPDGDEGNNDTNRESTDDDAYDTPDDDDAASES